MHPRKLITETHLISRFKHYLLVTIKSSSCNTLEHKHVISQLTKLLIFLMMKVHSDHEQNFFVLINVLSTLGIQGGLDQAKILIYRFVHTLFQRTFISSYFIGKSYCILFAIINIQLGIFRSVSKMSTVVA